MRLPRLFRTATFRLAFIYAALFAFCALLLIAFFDWTVTSFSSRDIDLELNDQMRVLQDAGRSGPTEVVELVQGQERALGEREFLYVIAAADGRRLAGTLPLSLAKPGAGVWTRKATRGGRSGVEQLRTLGQALPGGGVAVVGLSTSALDQLRERLLIASAASAVLVTLMSLAVAYLIGRQFLARVELVNHAAARIMEGRIEERLPAIGMGEEFDRLAVNLNRMLDRIQELMEGLRQVSSDIAHDLRTPLSRLRRMLEAGLGTSRRNPARDALAQEAIEQVDQILGAFDALLRIAQVEGGTGREGFRAVDLSELLERVRQAYEPAAEDRGQRLKAAIAPGVQVTGDEELIAQLVSNLIENAFAHAPGKGSVELDLDAEGGEARLTVADHGPGVPQAERDNVLKRFYRLDASRSTPGSGLGLSMVAAIARLHRATLALHDNRPGLRVEVRFAARTRQAGH